MGTLELFKDWRERNAQTSDVVVSKSGAAQYASGANGEFSVKAFDLTNCTAVSACGGGCTVLGAAQLACP